LEIVLPPLTLVGSKLFGAATVAVAALALHTAASTQASTSALSASERNWGVILV
jgi:hypothetical protein